MSIKRAEYRADSRPISEDCECEVCQNYSRAYLRHLYQANEILASRLNSYHNLAFLRSLMAKAREAILADRFKSFQEDFLKRYLAKKVD